MLPSLSSHMNMYTEADMQKNELVFHTGGMHTLDYYVQLILLHTIN